MRPAPLLTLALFITLVSACATSPPAKEHVAPDASPGPPRDRDLTCLEPSYLVRDLTVPWAQRTYLVGPCDGGRDQRDRLRPHRGALSRSTSVTDPGVKGVNRP
jgi:hypothetical protein